MPERILVVLSRPKDALAFLDEIIMIRAQRNLAVLRALEYRWALTDALAQQKKEPNDGR